MATVLRSALVLLAACVTLLGSAAVAQDREQLARDYHRIVYGIQRNEVIDYSVDLVLQSRRDLAPYRKVVRDWIANAYDSPEQEANMAKLYAQTFSRDELSELVALTKTKAFRAYLAKTPQLLQRSSQQTIALLGARQADLARRLQAAGYVPRR